MPRPAQPWFYEAKKTWYVWVGDKKVSLGVRGRDNKATAMGAWHRLMAGGRAAPPTVQLAGPTVAEVVAAFLEDAAGRVGAGTLTNYRGFLHGFSERHGEVIAEHLTPFLAESYARKPNWSRTYQGDFLTTLLTAFRWAERAGLLASNPLRCLRKPPRSVRVSSGLITVDQHARLLNAAGPVFRDFLQMLHLTGARPSEVAKITAENIDVEAAVVRLSEHKTAHKGKQRVVYLSSEAVTLLSQRREKYGSGYLFPNRQGNRLTKNSIVLAFRRLRARTGIAHATAYAYRHTFATDALSNGVPDAQVAELLGHSGTAMLHKHYAHLGAKARVLREALGRVR
jgi:integrase